MYTDEEIVGYVSARLEETWSPEQIACTPCGLKVPTARTIYRWLYEGYVAGGDLKVLRRKGRSRGKKETRGRVSEKTLKKNLALMNARHRKVLGFRSPIKLFESELHNSSLV